jgi:NADPH:quinone reductase-like Zn-dependent oxidoreductase
MKALRRIPGTEFGRIVHVDAPADAPGHVVVRTRYSAVNRLDLAVLSGSIPAPAGVTLGSGAVGFVERAGDSDLPEGTAVTVNPVISRTEILGVQRDGTHADCFAVNASNVMALPDGADLPAVAALAIAWQTAHKMVVRAAEVKPGEVVLVPGASGGVGDACVALCASAGATVIATTSHEDKLPRLRSGPGVHVTIDSEAGALVREFTGGEGVDCVLEHVGGRAWARDLSLLRHGGRMAICGATDGPDPLASLSHIWWNEIIIIGCSLGTNEDFRAVVSGVLDGRYRPLVDSITPLSDHARALERLSRGQAVGRIILEP